MRLNRGILYPISCVSGYNREKGSNYKEVNRFMNGIAEFSQATVSCMGVDRKNGLHGSVGQYH